MATIRDCRICSSPYREEIDKLIRKKLLKTDIAKHYAPLLEVEYEKLYESLFTHEKKKHPPLITQMPELSIYHPPAENPEKDVKQTPKTLEGYADVLLEMGFTPDQLKKVTPTNILKAQHLLLEKEKIKNQKDALQLSMAKLFAGMTQPADIVEGIVEEVKKLNESTHSITE